MGCGWCRGPTAGPMCPRLPAWRPQQAAGGATHRVQRWVSSAFLGKSQATAAGDRRRRRTCRARPDNSGSASESTDARSQHLGINRGCCGAAAAAAAAGGGSGTGGSLHEGVDAGGKVAGALDHKAACAHTIGRGEDADWSRQARHRLEQARARLRWRAAERCHATHRHVCRAMHASAAHSTGHSTCTRRTVKQVLHTPSACAGCTHLPAGPPQTAAAPAPWPPCANVAADGQQVMGSLEHSDLRDKGTRSLASLRKRQLEDG